MGNKNFNREWAEQPQFDKSIEGGIKGLWYKNSENEIFELFEWKNEETLLNEENLLKEKCFTNDIKNIFDDFGDFEELINEYSNVIEVLEKYDGKNSNDIYIADIQFGMKSNIPQSR